MRGNNNNPSNEAVINLKRKLQASNLRSRNISPKKSAAGKPNRMSMNNRNSSISFKKEKKIVVEEWSEEEDIED